LADATLRAISAAIESSPTLKIVIAIKVSSKLNPC
jgi:hypothetical protein